VRNSVRDSVWDSAYRSVGDSIWNSVLISVYNSAEDSIWNSVRTTENSANQKLREYDFNK